MAADRSAKIRRRALGVCLVGLAMWLASILIPLVFGEQRGWSEAEATAYLDSGSHLHALIESTHDHSAEGHTFADPEAEQAFRATRGAHEHRHVPVDPAKLQAAQAEFERHKARLDQMRRNNARQIDVLFWGGVIIGGLGAIAFFAAGNAVED